ncbi:MAG: phosphatidate cytidylyltransferase [Oscillospiraceae bacterium]|nr:phosphatidate cytidylyltransferase [Oscillospiraceae bacterium]
MSPILLGTLNLIIYFVIAVILAFSGRVLFTIPDEVFRKILHFILLGSFYVLIVSYPTWLSAALTAVIFEIAVYPILALAERLKKYSEFTTERKSGELKQSLLLVYTMFAIVVSICWGLLGDKYLALASFYAWGIGDAAAALVGKKFGRHKIKARGLDGKKSYEGTAAMFMISCISVFSILMWRGGLSMFFCGIIALIVGAVSAAAELYSRNGNDTVICPMSAMVVLLPLVYLFGGL